MNENTNKDTTSLIGLPRLVARVAALTLIVAALASLWRFFALQSPSSPLHMGPLRGPIESLAEGCWIAGFGGMAVAAILPRLGADHRLVKRVCLLLLVGWGIMLVGLVAGAFLGTSGTQVIKAYPRTIAVLFIKLTGFVFVLAGLLHLAVAAFRSGRGGSRD
jgi:hypothetical protein